MAGIGDRPLAFGDIGNIITMYNVQLLKKLFPPEWKQNAYQLKYNNEFKLVHYLNWYVLTISWCQL